MNRWILSLLLFVFAFKASAQFNVHTELGVLADDNIDNNALHIADRITTPAFALKYNVSDDTQEAVFHYTGALNYYSANTLRTHQMHTLGGDYLRTFGDESESTMEAKLAYAIRVDRDVFTIYDYSQVSALISYEHFYTTSSVAKFQYNLRSMNFRTLTDFNFTEHIITAKYSQHFPTGTTVIVNADLGGKIYSSLNDSISASGRNGRGKNNMNQWLPSVIQTIGSLRAGQSVGEGTGVSLFGQYQWNLRKQTRYMSSEYGLISDDAVFDDHYGYEGLLLQGMLTQKLPFDAQMRLAFSRQNRLYANFAVFDLEGNQVAGQRNDTRTTTTLQLIKPFESLGFDVTIAFDYIINTSNDPLYQYTNNALSIGISSSF